MQNMNNADSLRKELSNEIRFKFEDRQDNIIRKYEKMKYHLKKKKDKEREFAVQKRLYSKLRSRRSIPASETADQYKTV